MVCCGTMNTFLVQENILLRIHFHIASGEAEDMCNARHCIPHQKFAMTLVEQNVWGHLGAPPPYTSEYRYHSVSMLGKRCEGKRVEVMSVRSYRLSVTSTNIR